MLPDTPSGTINPKESNLLATIARLDNGNNIPVRAPDRLSIPLCWRIAE